MNVLSKEILLNDSLLFDKFWILMEDAFPLDERRDKYSFKSMLPEADFFVKLFVDHNEEPFAFISWWNIERFRYVEHFMVSSLHRSEGIGSKIFSDFLTQESSSVILEVEPVIDILTERRVNFYKRLGLELLPYDYKQPSYHKNYPFKPMLLMSNFIDIDTNQTGNVVMEIQLKVYRSFGNNPELSEE
jgi:GNAT superfamily N-acetyltransferase